MNAADHRHLTPWLVGAGVVLAAVWMVFLSGVGTSVHWNKATPSSRPLLAAPPTSSDPAHPLQHYAVIWQRPLFTTTRRPAIVVASSSSSHASLDHFQLTGVILAPHLRLALLHDGRDGQTLRVREGVALAPGGWVLQALKPHSAVFVEGTQRIQLTLIPLGHPVKGTATALPSVRPIPSYPTADAPPPRQPSPRSATADAAQRARIQTIEQRIKQRRHQLATHAGDP